MAKHEFRFIIDGLELTPEQQQHISAAIQNAGTEAVVHAASPGGGGGGGKGPHGAPLQPNAVTWGIGFINGKYLRIADLAASQGGLQALNIRVDAKSGELAGGG